MKRMKQLLLSALLVVGIAGVILPALPAHAINVFEECKNVSSDNAVCAAKKSDKATDMVKTAINTALQILGIVGVIMIIVGGFRYTTSGGDAAKLKNARDTIIYAVVGIVVAIMSYAIVNFVIGKF
jgi:hypothetical protein